MGNHYKCRMEAVSDYNKFCDYMLSNNKNISQIYYSTHFVLSEVEFESDYTQSELVAIMKECPDLHVMHETLTVVENYTGERRTSSDSEES